MQFNQAKSQVISKTIPDFIKTLTAHESFSACQNSTAEFLN